MAEKFLHGVEVLEIDAGPRPVRTVRSGVIGIVGTAPDAAGAVAATLTTGRVAANNAITFTAAGPGLSGNEITIHLVDPGQNGATLSVVVSGNAITINLATDAQGAITSTAGDVVTELTGDAEAVALVTAAAAASSDGTGVVAATRVALNLTGGEDEPFPLNTPVLVAGSRRVAVHWPWGGNHRAAWCYLSLPQGRPGSARQYSFAGRAGRTLVLDFGNRAGSRPLGDRGCA